MKKFWKTACAVVLASELLVPFTQVDAAPPTFIQNGGEVHYNWGEGSPSGFPADNFNGLFTQSKSLAAGDYFVQTFADDGVKVEMDGKPVIDRWSGYTAQADRAIVPNVAAGQHTVKTSYMEGVGSAAIFSDVVPFDSWLAYYYPGKNPSGPPVAAKTIKPSAENGLLEDNGLGSPMPGQIGSDNFSARYVTAKRLPAGDYILRAGADDGIRVYVDGRKVLDRWDNKPFSEENVKVNIADKPGDAATKDVHWIEVEYFEGAGDSKVSAVLTPMNSPKYTFTQNGGEVHYNWGEGGPPGFPADYFNGLFTQSKSLAAGDYFVQTFADDGVKVEMDGKPVIDRWSGYTAQADRAIVPNVAAGQHTVKTSYMEGVGSAAIFSDVVPFDSWLAYYYPGKNPSGPPVAAKTIKPSAENGLLEDNGGGSPMPGQIGSDNFSARYVTAKRLPAGDYILRAGADDGIRVYVDGRKVLDRWDNKPFSEENVRVNIADKPGDAATKDVHWIEVEYFDSVGDSKVSAVLTSINSPKYTFTQNDGEVHYNWGEGSPSGFPADNFNGLFTQSKSLAAGDYFVQTFADDGVKVEMDGKPVIDRWSGYTAQADRAIVPNMAAGQHTVKTSYMEGVGSAAVFSDVVPFDNWLAYYYSGENPSGPPVAAKTIKPSAENGLLEDNGLGSPMPGQIGSDHFSARYVTAKRLPAGEYVLRGRADDGIRVRVDGKLVLDRWSASGYREDAVKISVSDNPTDDDKKNVHWIEVEYLELTGASKVELTVTPYSDVLKYSSAVGTFFNNPNGSGDGVVVGGANSLNSLNGIAFNWGSNAPMPSIGSDNFSAVFYENRNVTAGDYFIQTFADDNVRVEVDGKPVIDRWSGYTAQADRAIVPNMAAGQHTVKTSYMEGGGDAGIFSHLVPFDSWLAYYYPSKNPTGIPTAAKVMANLSDNSGLSSPFPGIIPDDNFSARYVTAKHMPAGRYKILTKSDDGVRVYVDGKLVINRWTATVGDEGAAVVEVVNSTTETNASLQDVHWIEVEYYEGVGSSFVSATVEPTTLAVTPPPPVAVPNGAYKSAKIYKANGGKQTDYIDGYNTYDEAVRAAADNGANAVLNNDRVVWVNNGFAYADDITINIYSAPGSGNALTYVARSTELKVEAVEGDWVKVRLADTIGYVQKDKVVLVPKDAADSSYFTVKNGDLYYYISHNGWYDMQLYGKAPSFLTPGEKYYSVNGHEFNGQEAYQYFQYLSAHTKTNYTAEELNAYVSQVKPESPLKDLGAAFKKAEADYNVNAMMLLAIAIHESNYGLNRYAGDYRNIFSINATDRNTSENAFVYPTYEACIEEMAKNYMGLGKRYSNPADWRYEGAYLGDKSTGMNVQYASDADWGSGIASVMYQIDRKLGGKDWGKYSLVKPTADTLNVRPAASTSQAVLYQVNNSMVLTKLGDEADWTKIIADVPVSITGSNGEPAAYTATQYARILSIIR